MRRSSLFWRSARSKASRSRSARSRAMSSRSSAKTRRRHRNARARPRGEPAGSASSGSPRPTSGSLHVARSADAAAAQRQATAPAGKSRAEPPQSQRCQGWDIGTSGATSRFSRARCSSRPARRSWEPKKPCSSSRSSCSAAPPTLLGAGPRAASGSRLPASTARDGKRRLAAATRLWASAGARHWTITSVCSALSDAGSDPAHRCSSSFRIATATASPTVPGASGTMLWGSRARALGVGR
mmetsp:Transcript_54245/g.173906  ORF Transcript_54245/g.173906 Transcript_54245/m.173906 type:complete len:241 (+) Transcript_54245:217-939(+)